MRKKDIAHIVKKHFMLLVLYYKMQKLSVVIIV